MAAVLWLLCYGCCATAAVLCCATAAVLCCATAAVLWVLCCGCCNNGGMFAGQDIGPGNKAPAKQAARCV